MTGAIVVGDGKGVASGETITVEPFAPEPKAVTRVVTESSGLPAVSLILAAALGALVGAGAVRLGRTRSRRAPVAAA
jgi:hypothetical protein